MIAPPSTALRPHRILLQKPGPEVPTDDGYAQSWIDLAPPKLFARIDPATARDLERVFAGAVISTASHVVRMPYHPGITTKTRIIFNGRTFEVTGVSSPEERQTETVCAVTEEVA